MKKPEPKTVSVVCSVCDQPWDKHGAKPTLEDCVRLLKAELAKRSVYPRQFLGSGPNTHVLHPARGIPIGPDTQIGRAS